MEQLDLDMAGQTPEPGGADWLDADEDSDSYQSTNPPRYIEARAKVVFPDCDYPITKPVNIIGRGAGLPRVLASRNLDGSDAGDSEDYIATGSKRRRRNSTEYYFRGGVGGPQSPAPSADEDPEVERINIWPPQDEDGSVPNTISRDHAKIVWDTFRREWVLEVLGRNGLYLQGSFYRKGDCVYLKHGDNIVISRVDMHFFSAGDNGDDFESSENGVSDGMDELSQIAESMDDENGLSESRSPVFRRRRPVATIEADDDDDDEEEEEEEEEEENDDNDNDHEGDDGGEESKPRNRSIKLRIKPKPSNANGTERRRSTVNARDGKRTKKAMSTQSEARSGRKTIKGESHEKQSSEEQEEDRTGGDREQRKRGPGRPPADGVMSKKERRDRERAKRLGLEYGKDELPVRPHNKPRKEKDNADEAADDTHKAKKAKRKSEGGQPDDEDTSPEKTVLRREPTPRPATPEPRREDFTQEQLQKPELTYHVMLVDILSHSDRSMSLPEIYKAFKKKWPYFYFLGSHGWESSIRHNLQSSTCILKDGKQGKGHNWKFHPELMKEEPKQSRQKPQPIRTPAYPPMPHGIAQGVIPQPGFQHQMHANYQHPQHQQQTTIHSAPPQYQAQNNQVAGAQTPSYPQAHTPQLNVQYQRPVGQVPGSSNGVQQQPRQPHGAMGSNGLTSQSNVGISHSSIQQASTQQPQTVRPQYPSPNQQYVTNGSTPHSTNGQARLSTPTSSTPYMARSTVPGPVGNNLAGTKSARDNKRQVFEHFRTSLVKNVRDEETKLRYNRLVNQAIDWLMRNPDATSFSSGDSDLNKVVPQMMSLWSSHPLNQASSNFSGYGSPAMRQSPSITTPSTVQSHGTRPAVPTNSAGASQSPSTVQQISAQTVSQPTNGTSTSQSQPLVGAGGSGGTARNTVPTSAVETLKATPVSTTPANSAGTPLTPSTKTPAAEGLASTAVQAGNASISQEGSGESNKTMGKEQEKTDSSSVT